MPQAWTARRATKSPALFADECGLDSDQRIMRRRDRATARPPGGNERERSETMIAVGESAPEFSLSDQFGRTVELSAFRGRSHVLVLFYPLDWTPT